MRPPQTKDCMRTDPAGSTPASPASHLPEGTPVIGGWSAGRLLGEDGPVQRLSARGPQGQRALLEVIAYRGREPLDAWMTDFIEEIETWGDAAGGPLLRVVAAGRLQDTNLVLRVIEAAPGVSFDRLRLPLSAGRAVRIAAQIARALAAAHARGLVHGQVDGIRVHVRNGQATLEPGGVRQLLQAAGADAPVPRGPEVAPEALLGQPDRPADVYALGALTCRLLSGHPPARGPEGGQLPGVAGEAAPELVELVRRCLSHSPHDRPRADEVVAELQALEAALPLASQSDEPTPPSLQRTVEPRMGPVDVMSPPAPPPAPELRSVVPASERTQAPGDDAGSVPLRAVVGAALILLIALVALALVAL